MRIGLAVLVLLAAACSRPVEVEKSTYASSLHNLEITRFRMELPGPPGGGIAVLDDGYLAATGGGDLYWFKRVGDDGLEVVKLPHRVPINRDEFLRYASDHEAELRPSLLDAFRTNDLLLVPGELVTVLVSYTYWHEDEACYSLRVSATTASPAALRDEDQTLDWETVYDSEPCLPWKTTGHGFAGQQAGGEMALSPDGKKILLTVGDFEFDGVNHPLAHAQDRRNPYGKLLSIDRETFATETIAWGLRNAQGLAHDERDRIWTTEHGPQGGDELNLILPGSNYGWPFVTYGTQYGSFEWPLSLRQSEHDGFVRPVFAWVPSVGASDLMILEGRGFPQWRGDLFVAALKTRDLLRVRVRDDRVAYVEPLPVDTRIRDMIEDRNGAIVLWTGNPDLRFIAPLDLEDALAHALTPADRGRVLFARCRGCHPSTKGEPDGIGPNLWGIADRAVAAVPGYPYSPALRAKGGTWTAERLGAYVHNPGRFAPGTTMQYDGLPTARDRQSLLAYLRTLDD